MPLLIRHGVIVDDPWLIVEDQDPVLEARRVGRPLIYPAAAWAEHEPSRAPPERPAGVWLDGDHEPDVITPFLEQLDLVAVRFPAMNDGRGLSLAVLLRTRYGYPGELRAIGAVHEDVIPYMQRCGFDAFLLPDGRDPEVALAALRATSDHYQGSVVEPRPAYRRGRV